VLIRIAASEELQSLSLYTKNPNSIDMIIIEVKSRLDTDDLSN